MNKTEFGLGDDDLIMRVLTGKKLPTTPSHLEGETLAYTSVSGLFTMSGGFGLLRPCPNTLILDMDEARFHPDNVRKLQRMVLDLVAKMGRKAPKVLPMSMHAFWRIYAFDHGWANYIELIHRVDNEAVFTYKGVYYLTGYDSQEDPPLYFMCQLPHDVHTVDEAREALKPASVKRAEAAGIEVRRQGDLFAIKSKLTDLEIRESGGKIFPDPVVQEVVQLYGTSHTAERVAYLGKVQLASGRMIHDPKLLNENRAPDHHPLELDSGWWWVARNTVPISGDVRESREVRHPERPRGDPEFFGGRGLTPVPEWIVEFGERVTFDELNEARERWAASAAMIDRAVQRLTEIYRI